MNIADIDRIALAGKRESVVAKKAKENQKQSKGRDHHKMRCPDCKQNYWHDEGHICGTKGLAKLPNLNVNTRRESAKAAGVGERTYDAGKGRPKLTPAPGEGVKSDAPPTLAESNISKNLSSRAQLWLAFRVAQKRPCNRMTMMMTPICERAPSET